MKVIVTADGGSRGNPGPAGYGAAVRDFETGDVLLERKGAIGVATNNVAEYTGLIEGLQAALDVGASEVDFRMDSKLVVEQMSGRWKIKNAALQPLALQARELASRFDDVRYQWIPRAQNSHADRLANEAMDAAMHGDTDADEDPPPVDDPEPQQATGEQLSLAASWLPTKGAPTRLILLRHGQTPLSIEKRYSGRRDVELTELGREQAAAAAKRVASLAEGREATVLSSPLTRTKQTAQAAAEALGTDVHSHEGLIETDFGEWDGLTFAEAAEKYPDVHKAWLGDPAVHPPGGESFDGVFRRVRATLDVLLTAYAGQTLVLVSHVTPIKMLLRLGLDAGPGILYRLHLDLASVSIVDFYPDGNASVSLVNDTSHLH